MKYLIVILLLFTLNSYSQNTFDAPWFVELQAKNGGSPLTYNQMVDAGNLYWETHNKDKKGSGYKVFMRWVETSKQFVKPDGTLQTNADLKEALNVNIQKGAQIDQSNWMPIGPYPVIGTGSWSTGQGRVNAVAVDPSNTNIIYIGTPGGGLFKSANGGNSWTPLTDFIDRVGASAIAIDPNNSNIIYVGTGDDDGGDSPSIGMLKSIDGGITFDRTAVTFNGGNADITEIYINPSNSNELFIATSQGLFKSIDAGATATVIQNSNIKDLKLKPGSPNTLYLASSNTFFRSTNGGETFTNTSTGLPASGIGRIVIATTVANPNYVYLLIASSSEALLGVYRSTDSGNTFTRRDLGTDILESTQAFYDLALEASQTNPEVIYTGCLNVWKSTNGGNNFQKVNNWDNPTGVSYTHADIHQIREFNGTLFVASDGGIYKSNNGASTFTNITNNAQISQFYRVAVGSQSSSELTGGLQDNGGQSFSANQWKNFYGADGMDSAIDPTNSNIRYGFIQRGGGLYITNDGGNSRSRSVNGPEAGNWITPLEINSKGVIYAAYKSLYRLDNTIFTAVSPTFPGLIDELAIDPNNDAIFYASYNAQLYKSTNAGVSFNLIFTANTNIEAIDISYNDTNIIYISTSGSNGIVYKSENQGTTFKNITGNLPNVSKNALASTPLSTQEDLYVGTSIGVYRLDATNGQWSKFGNNLPNTSVRALEINVTDKILTAATYGRGIWQTAIPIQKPNREIALINTSGIQEGLSCGDPTVTIQVKNEGQVQINDVVATIIIDNDPFITNSFSVDMSPQNTTSLNLTLPALTPGSHTIAISIDTPGDTFTTNNKTSLSILKNSEGLPNTTYNFESDAFYTDNGTLNTTSTWERGVATGVQLNTVLTNNTVYGTVLSGEYPSNVTSYLYTGCYDLTGITNPIVSFDMAYELEPEWDIVYMEYSTNGGSDWNLLGSANDSNWYNSSRFPNGTNCFNCVGGQWTGTDTTMKNYNISLSRLRAVQSIIFRLVFRSDQSVTEEGAIIDNFIVTGTLGTNTVSLNNQFSIYPNPSNGIFNIVWNGTATYNYAVFDITGKQIITNTDINGALNQLDLSSAASGIYLLKIYSENTSMTQKIIKN